jgi:triosephosphate isomerase
MRKLAAGNWKMNGTAETLAEIRALMAVDAGCEVLICPPATLLSRMADVVVGSNLRLGGQDCHTATSGAHTGDISARMLRDAGASHVILGHSERRADHGEDDAMVRAKVAAALSGDLVAVVCVGETEAQRDAGKTLDVVGAQLAGSLPDDMPTDLVVAYEPVWAIGTGRTPSLEEVAEVHGFIRQTLVKRFGDAGHATRLLYGGSVKPANAAAIFAVAHVDGALVGGASLTAADFGPIILALSQA